MEYIEEKENNLVKSAALISQFKTLLFGRQNDKKNSARNAFINALCLKGS